MRCQPIVCRQLDGETTVGRVWEDSETVISIHTEDQYQSHEKWLPHLEPVGFLLRHVFIHNPEVLTLADLWNSLDLYRPERGMGMPLPYLGIPSIPKR
jgi:hypothetical protein